jgi:hypothetical protein
VSSTELAVLALRVPCGFCWAPPGTACAAQGQHLARYLRAYRKGLISRELMTSACLLLPAASSGQIVTEIVVLAPETTGSDGDQGARPAAFPR